MAPGTKSGIKDCPEETDNPTRAPMAEEAASEGRKDPTSGGAIFLCLPTSQ